MARYGKLFSVAAATSFLSVTLAAVGDICFYPDGITTEPTHKPCNTTLSTSACCDPLDSCSTSGLCLGRSGFVYRGSCTDRTWKSANCPTTCLGDPFNNQAYSGFTPLWPCGGPGGNSFDFCCNSPNRNCCELATFPFGTSGFAFKLGMDTLLSELANFSASASNIVTVTATAPASVVETSSSTSAVSLKTSSSSPSSSNLGPAIGLGIGLPLGLLAIGILSFLFWRERKHSRAKNETRMKIIEMDPGRYAQETQKPSNYYPPGPPPAPPKTRQLDKGTWNSQTSTLPSRSTSIQKSPRLPGGLPTGVHELI